MTKATNNLTDSKDGYGVYFVVLPYLIEFF